MNVFFDSSAWAKRYLEETGSSLVEELCFNANNVTLSILCIPELISAFSRLQREEKISANQALQLKNVFFAEIKGVTGKEVQNKALQYLERFDLLNRKDSKIEDLSKGNQQKVQFIATILHNPEFIILDEPFSALDVKAVDFLQSIISKHVDQGGMVILTTHQEVELTSGSVNRLQLAA